jgi:hypothetical protein
MGAGSQILHWFPTDLHYYIFNRPKYCRIAFQIAADILILPPLLIASGDDDGDELGYDVGVGVGAGVGFCIALILFLYSAVFIIIVRI